MSIADTDALAAALEGGDVPAQVGFPSFAGHLINNAKIVFEEPDLREAFMLMCAASTGLKTGAGMDIPPAFSTFISTAAGKLAKWIRNTSAEAVGDTVNDNTRLLDALDSILHNEDLEAKNMRDDRMPNMLCILLGGKEELERNAHSEPREPIGTSIVDCGTRWCAWCALYAHRLCSVRLPAQLAHMSHAALCCLLAPAKPARQDTRRGAVCRAKRQPPAHTLLAPRPLANACLCEALGR